MEIRVLHHEPPLWTMGARNAALPSIWQTSSNELSKQFFRITVVRLEGCSCKYWPVAVRDQCLRKFVCFAYGAYTHLLEVDPVYEGAEKNYAIPANFIFFRRSFFRCGLLSLGFLRGGRVLLFFSPSPSSNRLWFRLFYQPVCKQTGEHEGQKATAHAGAYEGVGSRLEGGGEGGVSARIWFQLRDWLHVAKIWCGFAEKGRCEGGHGCMCQGGGLEWSERAAATLCWRMAGAWRALARAKLLKAAASLLHLPPARGSDSVLVPLRPTMLRPTTLSTQQWSSLFDRTRSSSKDCFTGQSPDLGTMLAFFFILAAPWCSIPRSKNFSAFVA